MNRAVLPGGPGRVRLAETDFPAAPHGDQLLVRMRYAPVNPADLLAVDGRYAFDLPRDQPLGAEGVGQIEAVGDAVADLRPGDLVLPLNRGNWSEWRLVSRDDLAPVPEGCDIRQAAMLRINPATAWLLLEASAIRSGEALVQNGAGSAVAYWVRRFARHRDVQLIDVVRRPLASLPYALTDSDDLAGRAREAAGGRTIRAALDCVAGAASGRLAACLAPRGRLMIFGHLSGDPVQIRSQLLTAGGLSVVGFSLRPAEAELGKAGRQAMFARLAQFHVSAPPSLPVRAIVPLSRAEEGIALARAEGQGRVLLDLTQ